MTKRNLDGVYFHIMRDGKRVDICWTDLEWEDRIEQAHKNNNEGWLMRMIQIMNGVANQIHDEYPDVDIREVHLREGAKTTKPWLRNALYRLTAEIRMAAEEHNIVAQA